MPHVQILPKNEGITETDGKSFFAPPGLPFSTLLHESGGSFYGSHDQAPLLSSWVLPMGAISRRSEREQRKREGVRFELCPHLSNSYIKTLTSGNSECDVFGNRIITNIISTSQPLLKDIAITRRVN